MAKTQNDLTPMHSMAIPANIWDAYKRMRPTGSRADSCWGQVSAYPGRTVV